MFSCNISWKRSLYVKLKDWITNSVDPDETAHLDLRCLQKPILSPVAVKELFKPMSYYMYFTVKLPLSRNDCLLNISALSSKTLNQHVYIKTRREIWLSRVACSSDIQSNRAGTLLIFFFFFFWLKIILGLSLTWANTICSGETARMRGCAGSLEYFPLAQLNQ